ncbi:MAG: NAD(P)-dependent oxidoreductase [Acidobacteria bacterium]|jgi:nucleoside-diphosphate-sugar epimerase|nr:MAG: NAD(P)-dependent oxidoreductase [Acidobacteriota bacterium]GIU82874.1 MAG: CDP-paratose 2-epimerase [Pyrinomonadaceae bacterium]
MLEDSEKKPKMKILVTGGSGFLGTHVRSFFNADDFSRRSNLDLLNLQDVTIVENYDVVIHLAALLDKSPENAEEVFLVNVEGTVNLLRSMRENSVFIFASTKDVYGRFADNYQLVSESCPTLYSGQTALEWSKLIAERYIEFYAHQRNFRSCIFRLSTVYAPLTEGNIPNFVTHYADCINKGLPIRLPANGAPVRDILHVEDFCRACEAFIESTLRHGLYNLGGGPQNALSLRDLIKKMEEISGLQAIIDEQNPLPAPIPMNYVSDLSKVTHELDWEPKISIEEGLKTLFFTSGIPVVT